MNFGIIVLYVSSLNRPVHETVAIRRLVLVCRALGRASMTRINLARPTDRVG
jgi:hypothetical protein